MAAAGYPGALHIGHFHVARLLDPGGDRVRAEQAYRDLLVRDPGSDQALEGLAFLLQLAGRHDEMTEIRIELVTRRVDRMDLPPEERQATLEFKLASAGLRAQPSRAPAPYMARHFDRHAAGYDELLNDALGYRGPELIRRLLGRCLAPGVSNLNVLDAGCGTGLAGPVLRPLAGSLTGVDLSPGMLARARDRNVYDRLICDDLVATLGDSPGEYDVIAASDVLVYIGDLEPVFAAARTALAPSGLLVFTVECGSGPSFELRATGRYTHNLVYLRQAAGSCALQEVDLEEDTIRLEHGQPVRAYIMALRNAG